MSDSRGTLLTDRGSYTLQVARSSAESIQYDTPVIVQFTNRSDQPIEFHNNARRPRYLVITSGGEFSTAYNYSGPEIDILRIVTVLPGQTRTDTVHLSPTGSVSDNGASLRGTFQLLVFTATTGTGPLETRSFLSQPFSVAPPD